MIVVNVELHSAIDGRTENLGTLVIDNVGGTHARGDYRCRIFKKGAVDKYGPRTLAVAAKPVREGRVDNHARLAEPVHNLVAKAFASMGYR